MPTHELGRGTNTEGREKYPRNFYKLAGKGNSTPSCSILEGDGRKTRPGVCNQRKLLCARHWGGSASLLKRGVLRIRQHLLLTVQSQPSCVIKASPSVAKFFPILLLKIRSFRANEPTGGKQCSPQIRGCRLSRGVLQVKISRGFPSSQSWCCLLSKLLLCTDFQGFVQPRTVGAGLIMCLSSRGSHHLRVEAVHYLRLEHSPIYLLFNLYSVSLSKNDNLCAFTSKQKERSTCVLL